jgi:hypothetical protein
MRSEKEKTDGKQRGTEDRFQVSGVRSEEVRGRKTENGDRKTGDRKE